LQTISVDDVTRCMSAHAPLYARRRPIYQYVALTDLRRLWDPSHRRMLDVGGGTGVLAQTIKTLFGLDHVASVDVEDRFLPSIDIETAVYDGSTLPFPDRSFDCALFFNVLHHVPAASRARLIFECRRVIGSGPIYIKDHISLSTLDDVRLTLLDVLGNVPFGGMVSAWYLREKNWRDLASTTAHDFDQCLSGRYRRGAFEIMFPNRLETCMRWRPI